MAQVLVELDAATAERLNELAASEGKSASDWLADLIRDRIDRGWPPPEFLALAGAFPDFPTAEEIRAGGERICSRATASDVGSCITPRERRVYEGAVADEYEDNPQV